VTQFDFIANDWVELHDVLSFPELPDEFFEDFASDDYAVELDLSDDELREPRATVQSQQTGYME